MKLCHVILLRLSLLKAVIIGLWALGFYYAIVAEINDETDDALRAYAEMLILRSLAGERLPADDDGSNNGYRLRPVSKSYADHQEHVTYADRSIYFPEVDDYEPARTITYVFQNQQGQYQELVVYTPTIDKDDLKRSILIWIVVLYLGVLLGLAWVNLWTLRRSMRPLWQLLDWLDSYRLGIPHQPLHIDTRISEFKRLGKAVGESVERNERIFEEQKRFVANASHELQTPIAVSMNRLEMLLDDGTLTEEQMGEILKTLHTLRHMSELNKSLLQLCKIETGHYVGHVKVNFSDILQVLLPDLKQLYRHRQLQWEQMIVEPFVNEMDEALARMLLANLLKNAIVHTRSAGSVSVKMNAEGFRVANSAEGGPLDATLIFERFYHLSARPDSMGLGLSIVRAICSCSGLDVHYCYDHGMHLFEVRRSVEERK